MARKPTFKPARIRATNKEALEQMVGYIQEGYTPRKDMDKHGAIVFQFGKFSKTYQYPHIIRSEPRMNERDDALDEVRYWLRIRDRESREDVYPR